VSIVEQDLQLFSCRRVLQYPGYEIPPYTPLSPDQLTTAERLATLYRMRDKTVDIMVTSIEALLRRVMPAELLTSVAEYLMAGESCDQDDLLKKLDFLGYEKVALVQSMGDYSLRGGIIDIYPPPFLIDGRDLHEGPIRLDFFGDTIESLRPFDAFTQRSTGEIIDATLLPVSDVLLNTEAKAEMRHIARGFEQCGTEYGWQNDVTAELMDRIANGLRFAGMEFYLPLFYPRQSPSSSSVLNYLPEESSLLLIDPEGIFQNMHLTLERIHANYSSAVSSAAPALPPEMIFLEEKQLNRELNGFKQYRVTDFPHPDEQVVTISSTNHQLLKQEISLKRAKLGLLAPLTEQITRWRAAGDTVIICCRSPRHTKNLVELFTRHGHEIEILPPPLNLGELFSTLDVDKVYFCDHPLSAGFSLPDWNIHILSESELFGEMRLGGKRRQKRGEHVLFSELHYGDIVVHREHGLAVYRGLETITFQSVVNDFMLLEYRDGDKLYLPVDRLNLISKYQGFSDHQPKIDKLGTQTWKTAKAKVKEEVWRVAQELLEIYATREIRQGRRFSPPGPLYHELEESFPFDETSGQQQSIDDVIGDLTSDRPMDRLVCGDVGYGKTEVAIRAAFKVVEDGYQVAILVPTTVLAEQHAKTFSERLEEFPITISCLTRFRTTGQQRKIVKDITAGRVDIVIGTHRLLSKDVSFSNIGLLIIDEEHRFGVAHKERLKKMRAEVDILTLTATPIPRTLQMSLLSIRDLSIISTPPEHRRPVKTFVARYDELVIKEAVSKELRRGGQVFFVHNRVKSIHGVATIIQKLVPEAKIAVAHGQMAGKDLENIMVSFIKKEINVLVSTTIIESGLDIPSANTIVINRADMLGLAEIYQLRGRVGRSSAQSFAYLLVPSLDSLSKDTRERLRALMDCSELGGGFKLAMSDLQIRGGGNLLGISQSGNIAAIGYDLYLDLLQKTVADLKARAARAEGYDQPTEALDPEINLQLSAYIPEHFIPDINQRYIAYRRIAALATAPPENHEDLQDELVDRYGPLPAETATLFRVVTLKKDLATLGIEKLEQGPDSLVFSFADTTPISPDRLLAYLQQNSGSKDGEKCRFTPDGRLVRPGRLSSAEHIFATIETTLKELKSLVQQSN
ncbi:MAG: transcription-repair coupling factor, partial [Desulforhopalus sp.]